MLSCASKLDRPPQVRTQAGDLALYYRGVTGTQAACRAIRDIPPPPPTDRCRLQLQSAVPTKRLRGGLTRAAGHEWDSTQRDPRSRTFRFNSTSDLPAHKRGYRICLCPLYGLRLRCARLHPDPHALTSLQLVAAMRTREHGRWGTGAQGPTASQLLAHAACT